MKCSKMGITLAVWCVILAAIWTAPPVQAQEQFVLVDVEYTATAQDTMDSHYRVKPKAGIPSNWRTPTNYANGTVYVELEVLQKPGSKNTFYNICIENASNPACLPYMMYTSTGKYKANFPFSRLWQYSVVDWTMGCTEVSLILKDDTETKQQGNPDFYPYKAHVVITVVPPGGTYVPPSSGAAGSSAAGGGGSAGKAGAPSGGSSAMAGKSGSSAGSAGNSGSGGSSAGTAGKAGSSAGSGGSKSAATSDAGKSSQGGRSGSGGAGKGGSSASSSSAGSSATANSSEASAGTSANRVDDKSVTSQLESTDGCSTSGSGAAGAGWFLLGLALLRRRKR